MGHTSQFILEDFSKINNVCVCFFFFVGRRVHLTSSKVTGESPSLLFHLIFNDATQQQLQIEHTIKYLKCHNTSRIIMRFIPCRSGY